MPFVSFEIVMSSDQVHREHGIYVPELIFGHLLTSSNYDDSIRKTTGGRNGYGAKLTNIFSKEFIVETADESNGKIFKQVCLGRTLCLSRSIFLNLLSFFLW